MEKCLTEIDADYMNSRFDKYLKAIQQHDVDANELQKTLNDLHKSFAMLGQKEQKYTNIFLHDVAGGEVKAETVKTFRDDLTEYQTKEKNEQIQSIVRFLGLDECKLRNLLVASVTEASINEFGRLDDLKDSVDITKATEYFEKLENVNIPSFKAHIKMDVLLRKFILENGFEIEDPSFGI